MTLWRRETFQSPSYPEELGPWSNDVLYQIPVMAMISSVKVHGNLTTLIQVFLSSIPFSIHNIIMLERVLNSGNYVAEKHFWRWNY